MAGMLRRVIKYKEKEQLQSACLFSVFRRSFSRNTLAKQHICSSQQARYRCMNSRGDSRLRSIGNKTMARWGGGGRMWLFSITDTGCSCYQQPVSIQPHSATRWSLVLVNESFHTLIKRTPRTRCWNTVCCVWSRLTLTGSRTFTAAWLPSFLLVTL